MCKLAFLVLLVVTLCYQFTPSDGFCFEQAVHTVFTRFGRGITYCNFRGLKLLNGSSLKTQDCYSCNCTSEMLKCCGFGVNSMINIVPPNCKMVKDGCQPLYVLRDNENIDCMTGTPIIIGDSAHRHANST